MNKFKICHSCGKNISKDIAVSYLKNQNICHDCAVKEAIVVYCNWMCNNEYDLEECICRMRLGKYDELFESFDIK